MIELKTKLIFQNIIVGAMEVLLDATRRHPHDYIIDYSDELENDIIKCASEIKRINSLIRIEKINRLLL